MRNTLIAPVEKLRDLTFGHAAREVDESGEQRRHRFGRGVPLSSADSLRVTADEEIVRVVVVLTSFPDGADPRDVHEPLELFDRLRVLKLSFLRADAEGRSHPFGLRLAVLRQEVDDASRDRRQPPCAHAIEMVVRLAGAAEGGVKAWQHLHRDERWFPDEELPVVKALRFR